MCVGGEGGGGWHFRVGAVAAEVQEAEWRTGGLSRDRKSALKNQRKEVGNERWGGDNIVVLGGGLALFLLLFCGFDCASPL